jgi:hypothetical protein
MRFITTVVHGFLDYLMGVFLIAAPSAFGFEHGAVESSVLYVEGVAVLLYSVLTYLILYWAHSRYLHH